MSFPLWERGLKSWLLLDMTDTLPVVPLVGTWIEIFNGDPSIHVVPVVPLVGTWIEIERQSYNF